MHGFWKRPGRLVLKSAFMKTLISLTLAALLLPGLLIAQTRRIDTKVIPDFNLSKYLGTWYEIARFDHSFERNMDNVIAEYVLRPDGKVDVVNSGWRNGLYKEANGKAKQPDPVTSPAHLMVSFFLFFYSDYNILMLDDDYQVSLVGSSSPDYLWILSRTPFIEDDQLLDSIIKEAQRRGYDTSKLIWVDQDINIEYDEAEKAL